MPKPKTPRNCPACGILWPMTAEQKYHDKPCKGRATTTKVEVVCTSCGTKEIRRPDVLTDGKWRCLKCWNKAQITDERARFDGYAPSGWTEPAPTDGLGACVHWTGTLDKDDYGVFHLSGQRGQARADRYAWNLVNETLRPDEILRHKCDNPPCIRLSHLETGDRPANTQDMVDRDRQARGIRMAAAILNDERVRVVRADYATGEYSQQELADREGVSQFTISETIRGKRWKHVR